MVLKRLALIGFVLLVGYLATDVFVANRDLILAERVMQVAACTTVIYVYWPDTIAALLKPRAERGDYLVIGIAMGQFALALQALFVIVFRLSGSPTWLADADVNGIWILIGVLASGLHVLAPGAISGTVPQRNRVAAGVSLGAAAIVALFLLIARPDIGPIVERGKPYLADWFGSGS